jgi:hypothetical protein
MGEQDFAAAVLDTLISFGKAQFGDAVKAYWVYDGDLCPCCLKRKIDTMKYKGKEALSVNGFMYRERGVLIGYLLCGLCAGDIFQTSWKWKTQIHENIEKNLISAYLQHLASLDA